MDVYELGLWQTRTGEYIPKMQWPAHILKEWADVSAKAAIEAR